MPTLLNAVIGTKFKIVRGYQAANETMLAMERGEVEGAGVNWTKVKTAKAQWLREKKINVILQDLPTRGPDLQDVPALGELGDNAEAKQLLGLYANTGAIGRAFFAPPGLAPATAKVLRDGFIAMTRIRNSSPTPGRSMRTSMSAPARRCARRCSRPWTCRKPCWRARERFSALTYRSAR